MQLKENVLYRTIAGPILYVSRDPHAKDGDFYQWIGVIGDNKFHYSNDGKLWSDTTFRADDPIRQFEINGEVGA